MDYYSALLKTKFFIVLSLAACLLTACGGDGNTSFATDDQSPDPVVLDIPIAYIKRPIPVPEDANDPVIIRDLNDPIEMIPGAQLFVRPRSSNLADEINVTQQIIDIVATELNEDPAIIDLDIRGLEASIDGSQLIFSARAVPDLENNDEPELFTWNLWIYDFETNSVDYVIPSELIRNEGANNGGGHDMEPHFLTDDRIVFSSSRQTAVQEKLLNEGRGQRYSPVAEDDNNVQALALHVYDPTTREISQISLNRTADLDPAALDSGEVIFSRRGDTGIYSLYQINPSGINDTQVYGANSSNLVATEETALGNSDGINFLNPRELPDGRIMVLLQPQTPTTLGGDVAIVDTENFVELFTPTNNSAGGQRAQLSLTDLDVNALDDLSPGGKFLAAYSLRDGTDRILVSWNSCRIENGEGLIKPCSIADSSDEVDIGGVMQLQPAPPLFGLWMFDPSEQTQLPVVIAEDGFVIAEVVAAESTSFPDIPDESDVFDPNLAAEGKGLIIIDSVYQEDNGLVNYAPLGIAAYSQPGTVNYTNRPARFLRLLQTIPIPNEDVLDLGDLPNDGNSFNDFLEIMGYVPVEPDGSVTVKVPANTPLMMSVVDANGRRISARHNHLINVAEGEILHCVGCHNTNSDVPHGRIDQQPASLNLGAVSLGGNNIGFIGADPALNASELGQTMAEVYDLRMPNDGDSSTALTERVRDLILELTYTDEWTDTGSGLIPDADINLSYDPAWAIPIGNAIIRPNFDPELPGRIVINYLDHIQPIWDRARTITLGGLPVFGSDGTEATSCVSCHTTLDNTRVPAGQLDLTNSADPDGGDFNMSFRELLEQDEEYWETGVDLIGIRTRICDRLDINGEPVLDAQNNPIIDTFTFPVSASVNRISANASNAFFACFEEDDSPNCGAFVQDLSPLPANCTEDGGTISAGGITTKPIPDTFADAQALMAALMTPASLTDPNELMGLLQTNCQGCHSQAGGQVPHSDPDDNIAYNALKPYINLLNPSASTFVFRLSVANHQCWSADCDADAMEMLQAITNFSNAVPEEDVNDVISGGSVVTQGSFNHFGLLTPSELRLISEWIDIGTPFYTDPFDPRLQN